MANVAGKISAAPIPIMARQKIKVRLSGAEPAMAENKANKTKPAKRACLRPKRSPKPPDAISSPAKTRM